jgi:predicted RNase H-like HicB family nuclease
LGSAEVRDFGTRREQRYAPYSSGGRLVKFRAIIEPDEDGVFVATVPSLPGCISQGATRDEAVRNISEAITGYLESLRERGEPIPPSINEEVIDIAV